MYYLCEKHYKPITVQYYTADCVHWVPRHCWTCEQVGLKQMHSWNGTHSYIEDLLYNNYYEKYVFLHLTLLSVA